MTARQIIYSSTIIVLGFIQSVPETRIRSLREYVKT